MFLLIPHLKGNFKKNEKEWICIPMHYNYKLQKVPELKSGQKQKQNIH